MTNRAPPELSASAQWLVQALDPASDMARLVRMDADAYRQASFLDDRLFSTKQDFLICPWAEVAAAVKHIDRDDARWIFHIGHVGSTLLARLLGELPAVLSIREPRLLRDLTVLESDRRREMFEAVRRLFSRTFAAGQTALVKATSFVSEHAAEIVHPGGRALMMYATPRAYIETILAGPNSVVELRQLATSRATRSRNRIRNMPEANTDADKAALAWACEMTALEAAAERIGGSAQWLDFDLFLQDMPGHLSAVANGLGFPSSPAQLRAITSGPLTLRYSKDLSYAYTPALRLELRAEAAGRNKAAIEGALEMLEGMTRGSPLLARALKRASE